MSVCVCVCICTCWANAIIVIFAAQRLSGVWSGAERGKVRGGEWGNRGDTGIERRRVRKREQSFHGLLPLLIWQAPGSADISAGSEGTRHTENLGKRRRDMSHQQKGQKDWPTVTVETTQMETDRLRETWRSFDSSVQTILMYSNTEERRLEFKTSTYWNFLCKLKPVWKIENLPSHSDGQKWKLNSTFYCRNEFFQLFL